MAKAAVKAGVEGHGGCWMEAVSPSFCHEEPGGDEEEREHCGPIPKFCPKNMSSCLASEGLFSAWSYTYLWDSSRGTKVT